MSYSDDDDDDKSYDDAYDYVKYLRLIDRSWTLDYPEGEPPYADHTDLEAAGDGSTTFVNMGQHLRLTMVVPSKFSDLKNAAGHPIDNIKDFLAYQEEYLQAQNFSALVVHVCDRAGVVGSPVTGVMKDVEDNLFRFSIPGNANGPVTEVVVGMVVTATEHYIEEQVSESSKAIQPWVHILNFVVWGPSALPGGNSVGNRDDKYYIISKHMLASVLGNGDCYSNVRIKCSGQMMEGFADVPALRALVPVDGMVKGVVSLNGTLQAEIRDLGWRTDKHQKTALSRSIPKGCRCLQKCNVNGCIGIDLPPSMLEDLSVSPECLAINPYSVDSYLRWYGYNIHGIDNEFLTNVMAYPACLVRIVRAHVAQQFDDDAA